MNKSTNNNDTINKLRTHILTSIPTLTHAELQDEWWLLGTSGCHLCTIAEQLLTNFQAVQPVTYQHIDIANFDETLMMQFATTIPVLLTKTQRLNYPFSVLDLQRLVEEHNNY
ncbi:thioredoxin family protein [Psychrobacter frigidicola]|uniref:Thioredoxin family protein n=1 Tax=Psychrobacter frigidicola TaxID=45611 RepID=A0A5C7A4A4_9GAMM|nr:glutaredoxin family protein [Psychrobacter frigidicola]TXD98397.1 thioredoxin family protein [Psychrobacter frigidicola]